MLGDSVILCNHVEPGTGGGDIHLCQCVEVIYLELENRADPIYWLASITLWLAHYIPRDCDRAFVPGQSGSFVRNAAVCQDSWSQVNQTEISTSQGT
jgi:hypothetical protein